MVLNAFRAVTLALIVALPHASALAQSTPASVTLESIGDVCKGLDKYIAEGGRGNFRSDKGFDLDVRPDKEIKIIQPGRHAEAFTYQGYAQCVKDLAFGLLRPQSSEPKLCRDPSHGVERYAREFDVTRLSVPMSGGHTRKEWCDQLIGILRGEHPSGDFTRAVADRAESAWVF